MPSCQSIDVEQFLEHLTNFDAVFYKSLSRNDHQWADGKESHQSGVLIPREYIRFFGLEEPPVENDSITVDMDWILNGERKHRRDMARTWGHDETKLRYYCGGNRQARPEVHLTCVYNPYFEELRHGPLFVSGRIPDDESFHFLSVIADTSRPDLLEELRTSIDIPEGSIWGLATLRHTPRTAGFADDELTTNLQQLIRRKATTLYQQRADQTRLPTTRATSDASWSIVESHKNLVGEHVAGPGIAQANDPFHSAVKNAPGNLVRWILQKVEFQLVRHMERLHYPVQIADEIRENCDDSLPDDWDELEMAISDTLDSTITIAKSLTQSRRTRAGNSFEWHIAHLLDAYGIAYDRQVGDRRIDFVLDAGSEEIELSAKTTSRERWKQLHRGVFFITLDREISSENLEKIGRDGIRLVVPEKDKRELEHYRQDDNIETFSTFFQRFGKIPCASRIW